MSAAPRQFGLGKIERYVFRPLFVFLTFVMVFLAIVQSTGRFAMYALYLFDDEVNAVLAGRQINTHGLEGDWHGLNPVLRIENVNFPAGFVAGVVVEVDLLESMLRSTLIPQRLHVASADVHLEQTDAGWRLRGMDGGDDIDVTQMLRHVDDLTGLLHLHLAGLDGSFDVLQANIALVNRGGLHYGKVTLDNTAAVDRQFEAEVWQRERVSFVQPPVTAAMVSGDLLVPSLLSGMPDLTLSFDNAQWLDLDRQGGGTLNLRVEGVQLPDSPSELQANLSVVAKRQGARLRAMSTELSVTVMDDLLPVGPVYLATNLREAEPSNLAVAAELLSDEPFEPLLSVWLAQLQLDDLTQFAISHLGGFGPVSQWVQSLSVAGEANNVHVFYDPEIGLGYEASIADLAMQGYKGAPTLKGIQARLWGHGRGLALQFRAEDAFVQFPTLFHQGWEVTDVQGVAKAWFGDGYFGMQGSHIKARLGDTAVVGGFALARPTLRSGQRLTLQLHVDEVDVVRAKSFVPFNVPKGLADWIDRGPQQGRLKDVQYASHGQIRVSPGELGRRIELTSELLGAAVEYDPAWPIVRNVAGRVHVAGVDTRVVIDSGLSQAIVLRGSNLVLHSNASYVTGELNVVGGADSFLDFVRSSPLKENLSFITPGWQGTGELTLRGDLVIPIKAEASPELAVDLDIDLDKLSLAMPDYRIVVHDLVGKGNFSLPHHLSGEFAGRLFEQPTEFRAHYDDDWLRFDIKGTATPADAYAILDSEPKFPASGKFEFDSVLNLAMSGGVTNLALTSDLVGLRVDLPVGFAKAKPTPVPGELDIHFLAEYQSVRWRYQNVNGWLHYSDKIERGAIGIAESPPMTAQEEQAILIAGTLPRLVLSDWVSTEGDSTVGLPLDWTIQNLRVDQFGIDEMSFADVVLNGTQRGDDLFFVLDSSTLRGTVDIPGTGMMSLDIAYLKIDDPTAGLGEHIGAPQEDPVSVEIGRTLPAAQVNIDQLDLGDEPFGNWRFVIEPTQDRVLFSDFTADVNGVHIADSALTWDLATDQSAFTGRIVLDDLAQTLPKWDYAPSLTTDRANARADVGWAGSPLNVSLLAADGDLQFNAKDGRFIEVESGSGGLRILSLLNFTKIAKRINFDFSDVVGEGLSFEKIEATIRLRDGELTFPERMLVDTSSGNFQVGGRVDLRSGELDNEMIVTLPVSKSLPWYGVYLALANPLVGLGVVVGERVLRKPIEQFSTAKFEVSGTLDDPKVNFVSLWDQSMKKAVESEKPAVETEQETPVDDPESEVGVPTAQLEPKYKE